MEHDGVMFDCILFCNIILLFMFIPLTSGEKQSNINQEERIRQTTLVDCS